MKMKERQKERIEENRVVSVDVLEDIHNDYEQVQEIIANFEKTSISDIRNFLEDIEKHFKELMDDEGPFEEICSHCESRWDR